MSFLIIETLLEQNSQKAVKETIDEKGNDFKSHETIDELRIQELFPRHLNKLSKLLYVCC